MRRDSYEKLAYGLADAVCSAQDNLPDGYVLELRLDNKGWAVNLLEGVDRVSSRTYLTRGATITGSLLKAIDKAREREGLPT